MSYNHPYRNPPNDFGSEKDSQRIYPRESNAYRSGIRSATPGQTSSSSSELSVFPPTKALSFLHSCGLDAEDLQTLAKLPEHLITTDTLPDLLAEIKKKKISSSSSSRSSTLQAGSSSRSWDDKHHTQSVEYPLEMPVRQSYSLKQDQAQTWDDCWGNVQPTSSPTASNYVVEYNHLKEKKSYYDKMSYTGEPSREKTSTVPQSYSNYSRDLSQSSHLSSRDFSQSSHRSSRDITQSSHLSCRDASQSSHLSGRSISQSSQRSSRDVGLPSLLSNRDSGVPSLLSSRDIIPPSFLSSRDISQPSLLSSRDISLPSLLSIGPLAPTSRLSCRDAGQSSQSSHQWRKEASYRVPTRKEASDFHGRTPPVFPYACVLCEITVLSNKDWSVHIKGAQHAHSQLSLVEKYPQWDQTIQSARRNESNPERPLSGTGQERRRTSTSRNGSSGSRSEASTSKKASSSRKSSSKSEAISKCKVVCVKFEDDGVDEPYLKQLLGQFGAIVKMIMFPRLALVEMGTAGQAEDIVKYFIHNPLRFKGALLEFTLSSAFSFLQSSRVVSFAPLPSGDGVSSELTAIAKRFGSVKHSLFLPSRGYVEMTDVEEASKLVEHYSTNSLKLKGKTINVSFSSEYQTLGDMEADKEKSPRSNSTGRRMRRSHSPTKRRSHSSRRDSPSPKRRASEEGSRSRRHSDSRKRERSQHSHERSKQGHSSRSRSKRNSPSKDLKLKTEEGVEEMVEEDNDQSDIMGDDSDLEGVAVIADDGEALNSEDEFTVDEEVDEEAHDTSDAMDEQDVLEDVQTVNESNDQTIPSDMDTSDVQAEMPESVPVAMTLHEKSEVGSTEAQELQQGEQQELQQGEQQELQEGEQKRLLEEQKENRDEQNEFLKDNQDEQKDLQLGEQKKLKEEKGEIRDEQKELHQGVKKEVNGEQIEIQNKHKELQQGDQKEIEDEQKELPEKQKELCQGKQKDETLPMEEEATDFQENLENLIALEKLEVLTEPGDEKEICASSTEEKYGRVLEVAGFPVAKKYSEADLQKIGEKYGDVADCCLVRTNRKVEKALIEMVNAADAAKLEAECKKQHIKLGGKILRITVSQKYSQLNEGKNVDSDSERAEDKEPVEENKKELPFSMASSEEGTVAMAETETLEEGAEPQMETNMDAIMHPSSDEEEAYGRVLRIRNLPMPDEYTDADFLSIAEPYGKVKRHWIFRPHRTGLIEMENASDAEKVVANLNKINVAGKHPKISVSTKHSHLNKRYFLHGSSDGQTSSEYEQDESNTQSIISEQSSVQASANVKETSKGDVYVADDGTGTKAENSHSVSETQTPIMDPVGTDFVRPVVGYFCSLCNVIYASEEEAKDGHCRTPLHHQKLKEHKEQNSSG